MKREDRKQEIINLLVEKRAVDLDDLASRFAVSKMTIHRDLDELERAGVLRKVRGGATIDAGTQFESDFRIREMQEADVKLAIATTAAELVEPGMTVIINDGSMAAILGEVLLAKRPLTIITNSAAIMDRTRNESGLNLITLGGVYSAKYNAYFGMITDNALSQLSADIAFISAPAASGGVAYHMDEHVVRTKQAMMKASRQNCLLINSRRFGHSALHRLASLSDFDAIISDSPLPPETADGLKNKPTIVKIASVEEK
ncbi:MULTISPECIES: DeoR/GlpR family DNA-binding transcription regulator [Rhizobium/Agrobacterium group]|uniref:DeoR/GlpR family DNA-binding transcription regulator n=1 Tax=Rhizobium/Agrobacterium group TaxID=227290 RepID=UPI0009BC14CF|nr:MULTISPECIES: DeoR/GlpR family DNA-binding transcription regulator [Rhizobium/Agrobacterium group]MBB4402797.1 DeoR/GlpR family transcriptional regulator of sugar metabolism [Agrobacterium radiobacter]MBB5589292.1 DeoR/GlpR family transcriptional regulator of sugar metabolism [Agrobacterium radiobacter]TGE85877.1 DeoR/GlpR transcriptional regulator [Rhizobium sp. SEMIA 4032]WQE43318.1 DeoR/GlpR family DNA-binding transcription regulator [Agrobacterium tumefaciens]CUX56151.1 Transcriptional 